MTISLIWAQDKNGGIGINNTIPWYIKEDFKHFKSTTISKTVIMGRKTWDSLPIKPLPQRKNIILTKSKIDISKHNDLDNNELIEISSFDRLDIGNMQKSNDEFIVIGGGQIYNLFIEYATKLYVTKIDKGYDCDTFAPQIPESFFVKNVDKRDGWQIITYTK